MGPNGPRAQFRAGTSRRRPSQRPRDVNWEVKHLNGRLVGCGRGNMGLEVEGTPEGRSATRAYLGQTGELPRVNARASLLALTAPIGMRALSHPSQPTYLGNTETWRLRRRAVTLGANGQRAMSAARVRR